MISAVRTADLRSRRGVKPGFTLLEIVIVLALAAVLIGGAVGFMVFSSDERALRDASGQLEVLAKKARTKAILNQIPYAIIFRAGTAELMPFGQAPKTDSLNPDSPDDTTSVLVTFPEDMQISVLRWNSGNKWITIQNDITQVWRFDPEGLSEPLGIRYQLENSWQQDTYHPLTATIHTTEIEAR